LDCVTLECLRQALAGCRASSMALEDRLEEAGLHAALSCWRWAQATGRRPQIMGWYWPREDYIRYWTAQSVRFDTEDLYLLPAPDGKEYWNCSLLDSLRQWIWLLEEWAPLVPAWPA